MGCPANLIIALHQGHASTSTIPSSLDMAVFIETSDPPVVLWYDLVGVIHGRSATSGNAVAYTRGPGGTWTGYYNNGRVGENLPTMTYSPDGRPCCVTPSAVRPWGRVVVFDGLRQLRVTCFFAVQEKPEPVFLCFSSRLGCARSKWRSRPFVCFVYFGV
ncbi:unnamed protein product [Ectocarpus sp. CCAP 1310/34]|nr:unnamed protein product [Ectocarpus sp. CCAP 1310/34]